MLHTMSSIDATRDLTPAPPVERVGALRDAGWSPCVQAVLTIDGHVRASDLRQAIAQTIARHAVLRGDGAESLAWSTSDATAVSARVHARLRERCLRGERRALAAASAREPRVRAHLLAYGATGHDLVLTLDGRVADAA